MDTLGPIMNIGASEHWGKMGIWGKCTPGKMSTIRANQQLGQMGILGPMDIGADGHCWGRGSWGLGFRVGGVGNGGLGSVDWGCWGFGVRGVGDGEESWGRGSGG